jgi:hypothetical protein
MPRTAAEIDVYADAMADMLCAYLKSLEKGSGRQQSPPSTWSMVRQCAQQPAQVHLRVSRLEAALECGPEPVLGLGLP